MVVLALLSRWTTLRVKVVLVAELQLLDAMVLIRIELDRRVNALALLVATDTGSTGYTRQHAGLWERDGGVSTLGP